MKMTQINKLYAGFNGFEKAAMALDAAVNNDDDTLTAIVDSNFAHAVIYRRGYGL